MSSISEEIEFNRIELNPPDCVQLSPETELNRTQLNGLRSTGYGKPIQIKQVQSKPIKAAFLVLFTIFSIRKTLYICKHLHGSLIRTQSRTQQNKGIIIPAGAFRNCGTLSFSKLSKHLQATGKQPVQVEGDL